MEKFPVFRHGKTHLTWKYMICCNPLQYFLPSWVLVSIFSPAVLSWVPRQESRFCVHSRTIHGISELAESARPAACISWPLVGYGIAGWNLGESFGSKPCWCAQGKDIQNICRVSYKVWHQLGCLKSCCSSHWNLILLGYHLWHPEIYTWYARWGRACMKCVRDRCGQTMRKHNETWVPQRHTHQVFLFLNLLLILSFRYITFIGHRWSTFWWLFSNLHETSKRIDASELLHVVLYDFVESTHIIWFHHMSLLSVHFL